MSLRLKSPPKPLKPPRGRVRVLHCVRDVSVPEIILDEPRVEPLVSEVEPRRVAQHVRVDAEGEFGPPARRQCGVVECLTGERPTLAQEQIRGAGVWPQ